MKVAPAYHTPEPTYPDEPSSYTYTYAVADDKYTANEYDGYVADVTYEGKAVFPEVFPVVKVALTAPVVHVPPLLAHAAPVVHTAHAVHAIHADHASHAVHAPVEAAGFPVHPAGQVSHQSVSKPFQGEHRSTVQSKAFGTKAVFAHPLATHAIVDNEIAFENAAAQTEFKTDRFYSRIMEDDQSANDDNFYIDPQKLQTQHSQYYSAIQSGSRTSVAQPLAHILSYDDSIFYQEENKTCPIDQESDTPASPIQINSYHICPTNVTFQFDTTFMYLIAVVVCKILFSELKKLYACKEGAMNYPLLILFTSLALYGTYYCASSTFLCPDCHYTGKDRQYVLRHYTGKHNVLQTWTNEFLQAMNCKTIIP